MGSGMGAGNGISGCMSGGGPCAGFEGMDSSGIGMGCRIGNGLQMLQRIHMGGMGSGMGAGNGINGCMGGRGLSAGVGGMDGSGIGMGCHIGNAMQVPHAAAMQIPPGAYNGMCGGGGSLAGSGMTVCVIGSGGVNGGCLGGVGMGDRSASHADQMH